uniref:Uncharacterized protein n=1 Tax=Phenylobacterium glaciei TaxID=2803784 RepID=A0A974P5W1_9CAUL|nr:hypothetical protein JKL49_08550 [Phenylobacterium glaciei]
MGAMLDQNHRQHRERPTRAGTSVLTGRIFDASGQPMSPSFGYGRHGGRYRYYISMPLQLGKTKPSDEVIRRVSAPAVESYLVAQLGRLMARDDVTPVDLKSLIRRVELRATETHLVLDADQLFVGQHPALAQQALERLLQPDEQLLSEPGFPNSFRLVLAQRLQLRGPDVDQRIAGCRTCPVKSGSCERLEGGARRTCQPKGLAIDR